MTAGGRRTGPVLVLVALLAAACSGDDGSASGSDLTPSTTTTVVEAAEPLPALSVAHDGRARIVDDLGREVLLRGVNLNSLAEYGENLPGEPATVPVTDGDWDEMASLGFSVVRLLVSWSRLEPEPDQVDDAYLDQIRSAIAAAADRGIYTVVDLHQDAWGPFLGTPVGEPCPPGTTPELFWDGAPEWATLGTGGTCAPGGRETSPAVLSSWAAFYADQDGIRTHLAELWGRLAEELGDEPGVAGYDLLNEPGFTGDVPSDLVGLAAFYRDAIAAIRAAEGDGGHRLVFFEPTVAGQPVDPGFANDPDLVFAPHNYGDSISPIPVDVTAAAFAQAAERYGTPVWVGEYGWFSEDPADAEALARYAEVEDAQLQAGSAWWQWRQACGDPHSVGERGGTPGDQVHLHRNGCPGDVDGGLVEQWACVWRAYPRAAAGRLTALQSDCGRHLTLSGRTADAGEVVLWVPGDAEPVVNAPPGSFDVDSTQVSGGWLVTVQVEPGRYGFSVS